jgi:renalase
VTIVGAGMAGAACATALRQAGVDVRVLERGRAPGGRMASPLLHGRRVDLGAGYFTVRDEGFAAVVRGWEDAGLARPWTDTFGVLAPDQPPTTTTGPMRWATPDGLRSLVRELLHDIEVITSTAVDEASIDALPAGAVVLAMPDPQAARLVNLAVGVDYEPVIAVVAEWAARDWSFADAAFVHDHPDVSFIADDGARRGDGAAVLVAHTTADLGRRHLDDPTGAVPAVLDALREVAGVGEPSWTHAHRWGFAKPAGQHAQSFGWTLTAGGRDVGLAGDQWCPSGSPRVESAWRSGTDLAAAILARR